MKVTGKTIGINAMCDCEVRICQYDDEFKFVKTIDFSSVQSEIFKEFKLESSCVYIRLAFRQNSALPNYEQKNVYLKGVEEREYYEIRPEGGTQNIIAHLEVEGETLPDYGVLMLPDRYSNTGEPTRLIIFCHGAGAHYTNSSTEISGLDAEYFLSEGYAVMDMDENPFNSGDAHGYTPTAAQAYLAAYNWITENYNIRTDGILLGGRSMGGEMCFELMQSDIPVIAACPVVPVCNTLWWWNYMNASRRKFCADKMGFQGVEPTWSNSKKMSDEEFEYLYGNFDILKTYAPFWSGIKNLPGKDELFSFGKISASTEYDEAEYNYFSNLEFYTKAPVKMISCYEDKTVPYRRNAEIMYNMIRNSGQICELSMYHTDAESPHKFELLDSQAYTQVTTKYGKTMQAPFVYIEMMEFWRRFK